MMIACPGDCNCVTKELDIIDLILNQTAGAIRRSVVHEEEIRELKTRVEHTAEFSGIIGKDPQMQKIYRLIEDIAPTDTTVLIQGESGTGKELVARAIHRKSQRMDKPFIVINCSAYPATLLESELFGHEKGAFTGAIRQKSGRFEQADGGTVFLDEIGEIAPSAQIKLLRVLQSQKFERVGGEKTLTVNVRVLAATNKELLQEVQEGSFREDLFYRLNVIPIQLPPLRKRHNDIPLLARHFLRRFATEQNKEIQDFSSEAMRLLLDYPWPGNVRELENSIEHAAVLAKQSNVEISDLPSTIRNAAASVSSETRGTIFENEKKLLQEVLEECDWNKKKAALQLGISRSTLYEKLKKYQIIISKPTIH
jgi:two-component system response regulator HydG